MPEFFYKLSKLFGIERARLETDSLNVGFEERERAGDGGVPSRG